MQRIDLKRNHACWSRAKTTGHEVERAQVLVKVDVKPLATRSPGFLCRDGNKLSPSSLPLVT